MAQPKALFQRIELCAPDQPAGSGVKLFWVDNSKHATVAATVHWLTQVRFGLGDRAWQVALLAAGEFVGAAWYALLLALLWFVGGRPDGAEAMMLRRARDALSAVIRSLRLRAP